MLQEPHTRGCGCRCPLLVYSIALADSCGPKSQLGSRACMDPIQQHIGKFNRSSSNLCTPVLLAAAKRTLQQDGLSHSDRVPNSPFNFISIAVLHLSLRCNSLLVDTAARPILQGAHT